MASPDCSVLWELGQGWQGIEMGLVLRLNRPFHPHLDGCPASPSNGVHKRLSACGGPKHQKGLVTRIEFVVEP